MNEHLNAFNVNGFYYIKCSRNEIVDFVPLFFFSSTADTH